MTTRERVSKGKELFQHSVCFQCHSLKGEKRYGPPLNTVMNKKVEVFENGQKKTIIVDRKYLTNSIKKPNSQKLLGFENSTMPETNLSDENVAYIVDYLISVNTNQTEIK